MNYDAGLLSQLKGVDFGDNVELITNKIIASEISTYNYISTENMLPNCGGVTNASSLPAANKFNAFCETDTLFSNIRTYFRKVWFADFSGGASADVLIFRTKNSSILDPHFLYYVVSNKTFVDYTDLTSKGAKMPRGDKDAIIKFPLKLPPISEQKAIASVLGALDDKIKNNRRMNETLEKMAQAIFKSWFVDFDPVHAKAAGAAPAHMDADAAALFPSSFGDDGLPVGWEQKSVLEVFDFTMGQSPPGSTYNEQKDGIAFWQGRRDFGFRFPSNRVYCSAPTRFADEGDTLISVRAPVGDVNRALDRCCIGRGVAALMHKSKLASYTYYTALQLREQFKVHEASGTVFGSINKAEFGKLKIVATGGGIEDVFESVVSTLDNKILNNHLEIETLENLRDTLLPKLMSGEIRVKDAERAVEAAV